MAEGKRLPPKPVLISFDDGYESNYIYAYPVLKRLSLKATINVITSAVPPKTTSSFDPRVLTYLSWDQMREMAASGLIDFQSHTRDLHKFIPKAPGKEGYAAVTPLYDARTGTTETPGDYERRIREDFVASRKALEENLGIAVFVLTYPYGVFSDDTRRLATEAGYTMQVTIVEGYNLRGGDLTRIKRINVSQSMTPGQLVERISGR
jgi:peptidoglycan/xylan/chitin deacetylase (PgdA/CDA1 family)